MTRKECLDAAAKTICEDREEQYGAPGDNFAVIAEMWEAYLSSRCIPSECRVYLDAGDVAMMLALMKVGRIATSPSAKPDSFIDLAGYTALAGEIMTREKKNAAQIEDPEGVRRDDPVRG